VSARRLVVGITGSSGVILGIRLLQALQGSEVETHLVVSPSARLTIEQETDWKVEDVLALAHTSYNPHDVGAAIASGSFPTLGMVVVPCSIKSLSAIANSFSADLLSRAADVTLKEGRPLLLVVRETPLHRGHIRQMDKAAAAGAIIFPPVPAFYTHPQSIDQLVDNLVGRMLARLGIENDRYQQWEGLKPAGEASWPPADLLALPAMTLATRGAEGEPHAAPVYFAAEGELCFYFFSDPASQHGQDVAADARAAGAIHPLVAGWQEIRGLQMRGRVRTVAQGAEWERAWQLYRAKFPFVEKLKEAIAGSQLYAFVPDWIRLVDNRKGFGYKDERELPTV
jgi:flavin prenyltransferase